MQETDPDYNGDDGSSHQGLYNTAETASEARAQQRGVEEFDGFGDDAGDGEAVVPEPAYAADGDAGQHGLYNTDETVVRSVLVLVFTVGPKHT